MEKTNAQFQAAAATQFRRALGARVTWRLLKMAGAERCCAMFASGRRCRLRAIKGLSWTDHRSGFCEKHGPRFAKITSAMMAAVKRESLS